jgi:hypothetical protein
MSASLARLHFAAGVAGSGKSYAMEMLIMFAMFGLEQPQEMKVPYVLNNNAGV